MGLELHEILKDIHDPQMLRTSELAFSVPWCLSRDILQSPKSLSCALSTGAVVLGDHFAALGPHTSDVGPILVVLGLSSCGEVLSEPAFSSVK